LNLQSIFYNAVFIPAAKAAAFILRNFIPKLKQREENAEKVFESLPDFGNSKVIWFHAASMGEFEQAKPVIEEIKSRNKNIKIVCSFYSPSGYLNQKNYEFADATCYMLFDSRKNAKRFVEKVKPDVAVFVRYDIWRNHLKELKRNNIPSFLINATFPSSRLLTSAIFLKQFTISNYELFSEIITINEDETKKFYSVNIHTPITSLSDTRFDRILKKVHNASEKPILQNDFFNDELVVVAGSCWEEDELLISKAINNLNKEKFNFRVIFVPHEPTLKNLNKLQSLVPSSIYLSKIEESQITDLQENHIIVDSIGKLLKLYGNADLAYVGGAFGSGIHSVTEPAGYGLPIACGEDFSNSPDAVNLSKINGLKSLKDSFELEEWLINMSIKENRIETGKINRNYLTERQGASEIISDKILEIIHPKQ
jgi:3-deoxy-D-manno-octulosonic-acid transferase